MNFRDGLTLVLCACDAQTIIINHLNLKHCQTINLIYGFNKNMTLHVCNPSITHYSQSIPGF